MPPIIQMLSDPIDAIRTAVETTLMEFCEEIKQKKSEVKSEAFPN